MTPKLLLFDIDGTLITSGGAGESALADAVRTAFGIEFDLSGIEIAGRTDAAIARTILALLNREASPENISALLDAYLAGLKDRLTERAGRVMPGILRLLEMLKQRPNLTIALLTGNLSRGAELKLTHYGLWRFFECGAFADDHHDRNQLGPIATGRAAAARGVHYSPRDIFVIGDTPHDIACGQAIGAVTVAVATGNFTREQLEAHGADFVFDDLSDVEGLVATLGW